MERSLVRKLAREVVIFMFICGFIGAAWAAVSTDQTTPKPKVEIIPGTLIPITKSDSSPSTTSFQKPTPNCVVRAPKTPVLAGQNVSCPEWIYWDQEAKKFGGVTVMPEDMAKPPACVERPYNAPEPKGEKPTCGPWLDSSGITWDPEPTPPFDPNKPYTTLADCPPDTDASTFDFAHPCNLTAAQQTRITQQMESKYSAEVSSRRQGIVIAGLLGFVFGALAGIAAWILYRAARFAITG